ncbi:hypothetical protein IFO69_06830 [Echinicola sp. CAU 1574]|uniref:Membrane metalloprotease n=1 Tax=Echinicola arenosa TaxID=2774144 RepID=A0ABR9AHZ2_9BACT|nr:hypothetical protein [Echinicola arenosa]MBD8488457.1 hypothetical protein [Echinicola arenosa]
MQNKLFEKYYIHFIRSIFLLGLIFFATSCFKDSEVDERLESIKAAKRSPGVSANEILSSSKFQSLELEIQYMEGYPLSETTITKITDWITPLINKPLGITLKISSIPTVGQDDYSLTEIREIEDNNRTAYNTGDKLGMYILVLDGYFDQDSDTEASLGFAHRNTSIALLGKRLKENSGSFGRPSKSNLETTVLEHELGHLMGLVNLGSGMVSDHEDGENLKHCDNEDCLMYWEVETRSIFSSVDNGIPTLDENCLNDLKANGGK